MIKFPTGELKPFVSFNGEEVDIDLIEDGSITLAEYQKVRANTPGFKALHSKLDNEAIKWVVEHYVKNCRRESSAVTYDYALKHDLIPELLKRIK